MHHGPQTPIHIYNLKMSERTFTAAEEREFERDYYSLCKHWQEEAHLRKWQKDTGRSLRSILRELEALREAEKLREWADIQAEWAAVEEPEEHEEVSQEEMEALYKAEWESMKVAEDAKGYEGDELVKWEDRKLENDMRFYPERFPERDAQILELVLPHLQGSVDLLVTIQEELAERLEGEDKDRFLAIPAATWAADGPIQKMIEDYLQTEELKKVILRATQRMSLEDVQESIEANENWVLSLRVKVNEEIRYAIVDSVM